MDNLYDEIERVKGTPYDFLLVTSIQKKVVGNKSEANCRLISTTNLWKLDNVLNRPKMLIQESEKTYSFKLSEGRAYDPPDGLKLCQQLCNDREFLRVTTKAKEAKTEYEDFPSNNAEIKSVYYNMVREKLITWYKEKRLDLPDSDSSERERKYKKEEFYELFNRYLDDTSADPDEVKQKLSDPYWKNTSAYLQGARRANNLTVAELKEHPGFSWIDPKGTAKD